MGYLNISLGGGDSYNYKYDYYQSFFVFVAEMDVLDKVFETLSISTISFRNHQLMMSHISLFIFCCRDVTRVDEDFEKTGQNPINFDYFQIFS